jgi:hypothetical protein
MLLQEIMKLLNTYKIKAEIHRDKHNAHMILTLFAVGVFLIMLILPGCDQSPYRTFTTKNEICRFSLEYPRSYSQTDGPYLYSYGYFVTFSIPDKGYQMVNPDPNILTAETVTVYQSPALLAIKITRKRDHNANTLIEDFLVTEASWANYKLLERETMSVSGIPAEYAYFVSSQLLPMRPAPGEEIPLWQRWFFFDNHDFIWKIEFQ